MFREMRRSKQLLSAENTEAVMRRCTNGILACMGDEGYPYAVPLSYVYHNGKIYFHTAKEGHKIDAIISNPKVSFTVVDEDKIISEEYTTYFRSVIVFGKARITENGEHLEAFAALIEKYSADQPIEDKHKKASECAQAYIVAIDIEHMTGKEAIEFRQSKKTGLTESSMNGKTYEYETIIQKVPDIDGAFVAFPFDIKTEFGKGRVKVRAAFDGEPYDGNIVNMGVKNADGSVCYVIGLRKDIRSKIGKQPGDTVRVRIRQKEEDKNKKPAMKDDNCELT